MIGRPLAGMLVTLFAAGPLLAAEPTTPPTPRDPYAGLELRMWEWRRLRNQLDMLPLTGMIAADDGPKLPDVNSFDKLVVDALRDVHNRGADLYNTVKDFEAAFRMYQGGLVAVRPLLAHRPAAQKMIEEGIAAADKEPTPARKAFKLHETIEAVRKYLKDANEPTIKSIDPDPKTKSVEVKKPKDPVEVAPNPKTKDPVEVKKPKDPVEPKKTDPIELKKPKDPEPMPVKSTGPSGRVLLKGKPLNAGELTLVSLDLAKPKVFTATVQADGSYKFAEPLTPGRYIVLVTAKDVPAKYQTTTTSGLVIEVLAGATAQDFDLK